MMSDYLDIIERLRGCLEYIGELPYVRIPSHELIVAIHEIERLRLYEAECATTAEILTDHFGTNVGCRQVAETVRELLENRGREEAGGE